MALLVHVLAMENKRWDITDGGNDGSRGQPAGAALLLATIAFVKILLGSRARGKRLPPTIPGAPVVGGLIKFMHRPIPMIREQYARLCSVIGPEVSAHFFKGNEAEMSQQEVYRFNVPTFGPGVVFDIDYSVRQEQFRVGDEADGWGPPGSERSCRIQLLRGKGGAEMTFCVPGLTGRQHVRLPWLAT
ncbi:cytochrome P450-like protein [Panicum miliaceum]|uniref:Cytochrome P450-like protein n=1 Tax=Panicum miliaceum TaxID=4540 RepID=A0A3L6T1D4_PANMI|nr:cytochrome P450-like protein [Panicum miliaceum]